MTHPALSQQLADADLARTVAKELALTVSRAMIDLRSQISSLTSKLPEGCEVTSLYDDAMSDALNLLEDAASDARGSIKSDDLIRDDYLDAVCEARAEQRSDNATL